MGTVEHLRICDKCEERLGAGMLPLSYAVGLAMAVGSPCSIIWAASRTPPSRS